MIVNQRSSLISFVMGLAHHRVSVLSVVEHWSVESEGLRFDSSWGLRIFSLSHAHYKTNVFIFSWKKCL